MNKYIYNIYINIYIYVYTYIYIYIYIYIYKKSLISQLHCRRSNDQIDA